MDITINLSYGDVFFIGVSVGALFVFILFIIREIKDGF